MVNAWPLLCVVAARLRPNVLMLTAALVAAPLVDARPTLTVAVDRVVVTGITPGGEAILFGRSIAYQGGVPVLARHAASGQDDDSDGTVTWLFDEVQQRSIWVAVDLDTGDHAIGSPVGATPRVITVSPNDWRENDDSLDIRREYVDFLLVRPRKGPGRWLSDKAAAATPTAALITTFVCALHRCFRCTGRSRRLLTPRRRTCWSSSICFPST